MWLVDVLLNNVSDVISVSSVPDWNDATDEFLAVTAQTHESVIAELIARYSGLIRSKARAMATVSVDADDLAQEGLLGLLNAISRFDASREIKFSTFADVCISNKMKTAIAKNCRAAMPMDEADVTSCLDGEVEADNPESIYLRKERLAELYDEMAAVLSKREFAVFQLFLCGMRYDQMAKRLGVTEKSVDNAMQRVRKKLKLAWNAEQHRGC